MEYIDQVIHVEVYNELNELIYTIDCPSLALMSMYMLWYCPTTTNRVKMTWPNGETITTALSNPSCWG